MILLPHALASLMLRFQAGVTTLAVFSRKFVNTLVHQCSAHPVSTDYSLEKVLVPWPEWLFNYNYSNMWMICWTIVSYRLGESVSIKLVRKLHVCLC